MKNRYNPHSIQKEVFFYFPHKATSIQNSLQDDIIIKFKSLLSFQNLNNLSPSSISFSHIINYLSKLEFQNSSQLNIENNLNIISHLSIKQELNPLNADLSDLTDLIKEYGIDVIRLALVTANFKLPNLNIIESSYRFLCSFYLTNLGYISSYNNNTLSNNPYNNNNNNNKCIVTYNKLFAKTIIETFLSVTYYLLEVGKFYIAYAQLRKLYKILKQENSMQNFCKLLQSFTLLLFLPFTPVTSINFLIKYNLFFFNSLIELVRHILQIYNIKIINIKLDHSTKSNWIIADINEWENNPILVLQNSAKFQPIFKHYKNIHLHQTINGWQLCLKSVHNKSYSTSC